ncbi:MAG: GatB/YqeY domain-containing protein [Clostridia bacterium]
MLNDELKKVRIQAMKDKDKAVLDILSVVLNKTMLANIEKRKDGAELVDADVVAILQKTEKELFDEKASFEKANRPESVANLEKQIATVQSFMPQMMSEEQIKAVILALPERTLPIVMKTFKAEYAGKCDMRLVGEVFKKL